MLKKQQTRSTVAEKTPAVVFGMFETGLGVARSLGQKGIKVVGVDFKKDIGFYSRYVSPELCPHPLTEKDQFLKWIGERFNNVDRLPIFITCDPFLIVFSNNREYLSKYFLFNLPDDELIRRISNKYEQYKLACQVNVPVPKTVILNTTDDISQLGSHNFNFPVIVKGLEVTLWRAKISSSVKGFAANNMDELGNLSMDILLKGVPCIVQEIIPGPDTNHLKYNCYINSKGEIKAEFMLRKIRQHPIHFGVGSAVESIHDSSLLEVGRMLFSSIGYRGIGSAEFKLDDLDNKLKLIEINPRYWQQNYLTTASGLNIAYINYCDLMSLPIPTPKSHRIGVKWVNIYMDFDSFIGYRKEGTLSLREWINSLKGKKTWSDFTFHDPVPVFFEFRFGLKLMKHPLKLMRYALRAISK
jgi:predicted ATP-grasp superfamily ATP-dependent carboligase